MRFSRLATVFIAAFTTFGCQKSAVVSTDGVELQKAVRTLKKGDQCDTHISCKSGHCLKGVCVDRCKSDEMCPNHSAVDGMFCRNDGRCSSKVFETIWEVSEKTGNVVKLPLAKNGHYSVRILWGDESKETDLAKQPVLSGSTPLEHKYQKSGTYHIKLLGEYIGFGGAVKAVDNNENAENALPYVGLKEVVSFGPVGLTHGAFAQTSLRKLPKLDIPDASKLSTCREMFYETPDFNEPVNFDTTHVNDMHAMFYGAKSFNQPIYFDTSDVADMSQMFAGATSFNRTLKFDTSKVKTMAQMLDSASAFNQSLSFDTSKVLDLSEFLDGASSFNQLLNLDLSNVKQFKNMLRRTSISQKNFCQMMTNEAFKAHADEFGVKHRCP